MIYRNMFRDGTSVGAIDPSKDWSLNFSRMLGYERPEFTDMMRLYLTLHCDHEVCWSLCCIISVLLVLSANRFFDNCAGFFFANNSLRVYIIVIYVDVCRCYIILLFLMRWDLYWSSLSLAERLLWVKQDRGSWLLIPRVLRLCPPTCQFAKLQQYSHDFHFLFYLVAYSSLKFTQVRLFLGRQRQRPCLSLGGQCAFRSLS